MSVSEPLEGLRVLDFCWIGAGALVTKTLRELGADIYRVESRQRPDNLRMAPPFRPGTEGLEASGYFASRNPGKKSLAINMSGERGRDVARELVPKVDVVTSNFRPGVMERWGFTHDDLAELNPAIVSLNMPMQGSDGPHANYIGFGATIAALSGLVDLTGLPGRAPVGTGTHYPDHVPNPAHALVGLLAAIRHQRRTGEGQQVELSQFESTVNVLGAAILETSLGQPSNACGNRADDAAPRGAFETADRRWLVLSCRTDEQFWSLVKVLDLGAHDVERRFPIHLRRKRDESELEALIAGAIRQRRRDELLEELAAEAVPSAAVNSSQDVLADATLRARGFWEEVEHPVIQQMPISRVPFRFCSGDAPPIERPPLLGEHTWEVLSSVVGMSRERYDQLVREDVLV